MRHHSIILVQGILILRLFALRISADICAGQPSNAVIGDPTIATKFYVCGDGTNAIDSVGTCTTGFVFRNGNCSSTAAANVNIVLTTLDDGSWVSDAASFNLVGRAIAQNVGGVRLWIKSGTSQILVERLSTNSVSVITARVVSHVATIKSATSDSNLLGTDISVDWTLSGAVSTFKFTPATIARINYPGSKWCCWRRVLFLPPSLVICAIIVVAFWLSFPALLACGVPFFVALSIIKCFKAPNPCSGSPWPGCFPADAILRLPSGLPLRMDHLAIGHRIAALPHSLTHHNTGPVFEDVYLFGHRDPYALSLFTSLTLANNATISLTPRHFIPIFRPRLPSSSLSQIYTYAKDVRPGDSVLALLDPSADSASCSWSKSPYAHVKVVRVAYEMKRGLYNPFTMGGNVEVNGVIASAHSNWYLDNVVPASLNKYLPAVYQLSLMPVRAIYVGIGPEAMSRLDEKFDFANVAPNGELLPYLRALVGVASSLAVKEI